MFIYSLCSLWREHEFVGYIINRTRDLCERMIFLPLVHVQSGSRFEPMTVRINEIIEIGRNSIFTNSNFLEF